MIQRSQRNRVIGIETPLGPEVLLLHRMELRETLGRPFSIQLDLLSELDDIAFADIIGQAVDLRLACGGFETRYINGFVSAFTRVGFNGRLTEYRATVVPWLWFLTRTTDCRIFQGMSVPDIIKQIFRDFGFSSFDDRLTRQYESRVYCVQYSETAFDFVMRLMEDEGIYFFFKHERGEHTLVLADAITAHTPIPNLETVEYQPELDRENDAHDTVQSWIIEQQIQPGSVAMKDYDPMAPTKSLTASARNVQDHAASDYEVFEYPGEYIDYPVGESRATTRIEELHAAFEISHARSESRAVQTGFTFELTRFPLDERCTEYLVTSTTTRIEQDVFDSTNDPTSVAVTETAFTAIPTETVFRPTRVTRVPRIYGPQTAIVVGPENDEIHTDEFGRIKVQFHWDRHGAGDENSSCWIRVAEVWAGKKWGAMFTPRVGHEVVVEFLNGNPDHPLVTGSVYNGSATPPFDLPAEKTWSGLKSSSTDDAGGANVIAFNDKAGEEELFIQAQHDLNEWVGHDSRQTVANNHHRTTNGKLFETIGNDLHVVCEGHAYEHMKKERHCTIDGLEAKEIIGSKSLTVDGDVMEEFHANVHQEAAGSRTMKASDITIEGTGSITLKVGGTSLKITAGGVQITAPSVTMTGNLMVGQNATIGANHTLAGNLNVGGTTMIGGPTTVGGPVITPAIVASSYTPGAGNIL